MAFARARNTPSSRLDFLPSPIKAKRESRRGAGGEVSSLILLQLPSNPFIYRVSILGLHQKQKTSVDIERRLLTSMPGMCPF